MATKTTKTSKSRPAAKMAESPSSNVAAPARSAATKKSRGSARAGTTAAPSVVSTNPRTPTAAGRSTPSRTKADEILTKAEATIAAAIESLNTQMNAAVTTLTELAVAHRGPKEAIERPLPLDRATTTFQRLVTEVVDDQLATLLPPIVALRNDLEFRGTEASPSGRGQDDWKDFLANSVEMLDQTLVQVGVARYEPHAGVPFDSLIHLAVGETRRDDLPEGVVSESLQPGFRTARGKVISPARVKVNRR